MIGGHCDRQGKISACLQGLQAHISFGQATCVKDEHSAQKQPVHERYLEFAKVLVKNGYVPIIRDINTAHNGIEINERLFKKVAFKIGLTRVYFAASVMDSTSQGLVSAPLRHLPLQRAAFLCGKKQ